MDHSQDIHPIAGLLRAFEVPDIYYAKEMTFVFPHCLKSFFLETVFAYFYIVSPLFPLSKN